MKILSKLWALPVLALTLASCDSENKGNTISQTFTNGFNYVIDTTTGESYVDDEMSYEMVFDFDNNVASVSVGSLNLSASNSAMNFELAQVPWTYNDKGYRQISVPSIQVGANTSISNFRLVLMDRYVNASGQSVYSPIVTIYYVVDGRYRVTVFMKSYVYVDNFTSVTTVATGDVYKPKTGTLYALVIDPKKNKASIMIDGAIFAAGMEQHAVQMTIPDVDITFDGGGYSLNCAEVIPTAQEGDKAVPYEQFKITDLYGYGSTEGNVSLMYRCANRENPCDVTSDLDYFMRSTSAN